MKNLTALVFVAAMGIMSSSAYAFITVIDATAPSGEVTTIKTATDVEYLDLKTNKLTYRGQATEAASLFKTVAENSLPQGLYEIDTEINEATGTVSVTIGVQGTFGREYEYWVIKKLSE